VGHFRSFISFLSGIHICGVKEITGGNNMDAEKSYYSNFMELKKERPELAEELAEEMC
jgi:hypothetical protein